MQTGTSSHVVVARIVKPHGIHGEVVLESFTDVAGRLEGTDRFWVLDQDHESRSVRVESRRFFQGRHVLKFDGISTRTEAEALRGMYLAIPEAELGTLPPNQFFIHNLIGMQVRLRDGRVIGEVRDIIRTGGVDLLEVGNENILIPFSEQICVEVDVAGSRITIDPPDGLLQLNAH
jgi:16S rRNA processing protein RimM